jgi:hypothetical protein
MGIVSDGSDPHMRKRSDAEYAVTMPGQIHQVHASWLVVYSPLLERGVQVV